MMKTEKIGGFDKYDVEDWLRAITKAADIKKEPKKLAAVNTLAATQLAAAQEKKTQVSLETKTGDRLKSAFGK